MLSATSPRPLSLRQLVCDNSGVYNRASTVTRLETALPRLRQMGLCTSSRRSTRACVHQGVAKQLYPMHEAAIRALTHSRARVHSEGDDD